MKDIKEFSFNLYAVIFVVCSCVVSTMQTVHGRYTTDITNYELSIPYRVSKSEEFVSFSLPSYFKHNFEDRFKRAATPSQHKLYYNIIFNGKDHHIELWPNHGFVSPSLVTEFYRSELPVAQRKLSRFNDQLCHYVGHARDNEHLSAALSVCDGLAGYLMTDKGQYFIEPIAGHQANANGEYVHVIYKRKAEGSSFGFPAFSPPKCGTREKWSDAWKRQLRQEYLKQDVLQRPSRNMHSVHHYLEILVVADKKFIDFHKDNNMEQYILTIMNMISKYYQDSSTGNQIDFHVVRIIYLDKPEQELDLEISQNAEVTLDSFCAWAKSVNPQDIKNPQHHDIAVLLTRYDLCSDNVTDCNLMGLAFLAAACDPDKACAINEDSGLTLGITVTHEVGHVMGCGHDDGEDSPCQPQNEAGEYYIMSPYVHMQTTEWSPCSKKFMTELFENQLGECLNDEPEESLYKQTDMPPGSVYDADYQCNQGFPGSTHCILEQSKICEMLYCKTDASGSCSSKGDPPADGTKCGENMWCYNTKCVEIGQRPQAIDGGWGEWQEWTKCSRTCGGGISYAERNCDKPQPQHGGRFCLGERKRVKLCSTNDCPAGGTPYRDQQCTEFNSKPFKDQLHTWKPFFQPDNPCQLACINENNVFVVLAPRAKDGTSCKPGTKNKCVFGVCQKVGCDWELNSHAEEDICGVCNGDGTHCTIVDKIYKDSGQGYQKIAVIPAGARNIKVNEKAASENTIAVSAEDEKTFYLNGNFEEEVNGDKDFGGVRGLYDHPSEDKESLYIAGPLPKPIVLQAVFYNKQNPGIEYKYAEPLPPGAIPPVHPVYNWEFVEFGECSARCGPGLKTAEPVCVEKKEGKVGEKFCQKIPKPEPKTEECNEKPCTTQWRTGGWNKCSGCKGRTGTKTRTVECVREASVAGRDPVIVEDSLCKEMKPAAQEMCCSNEPCKSRRSTNEFDRKFENLWHQLQKIKKRSTKFQQDKRTFETKKSDLLLNAQGKYQRNLFPENNNYYVEKYYIQPKLSGKQSKNDLVHYNLNKQRKNYLFSKRNLEECKNNLKNKNQASKDSNSHSAGQKKQEKFISDRLPSEGNKLIEVPIKENGKDVKLSDAAFEAEGDQVADTLDFCNAKVFTGKSADNELKRLNNNHTKLRK